MSAQTNATQQAPAQQAPAQPQVNTTPNSNKPGLASSVARYKSNQTAMGSTTGDERKEHGIEAYVGRVQAKHIHLEEGGGGSDPGHQQQINGLGQSFRNAEGLPAYQEVTGAAPPPPKTKK